MRGIRLAGLLAIVVAGGSAPTAADEDARGPLDAVAAAYRGLEYYQDHGRILLPGEPPRSAPMSVVMSRPNRLNLDAGTVRMVCDGRKLVTWNLATRSGVESDAPAVIRPAAISEGSLGAMVLGGPGGRPAGVVVALLFAEDAAAALCLGGAQVKPEPDRDEGGKPCKVVRIDHVSGPDLLLGIDPETRLLRWVELTGADARPSGIRWEAGEIATTAPADDGFRTDPPEGVTRVAPLRGEPPEAPAPRP